MNISLLGYPIMVGMFILNDSIYVILSYLSDFLFTLFLFYSFQNRCCNIVFEDGTNRLRSYDVWKE
jgi:hypothetical protein